MKKLLRLSLLLLVILPIVKANARDAYDYYTSLNIGYNSFYEAPQHLYKSGTNSIYINVWRTNLQNGSSTITEIGRLGMRYVEDSGTSCIIIGTTSVYTNPGRSISHSWGNLAEGNRYYDFYTNIDGKAYNGVTSNNVVLSPVIK